MFSIFEEYMLRATVIVLRHIKAQYSSANTGHSTRRIVEGSEKLIDEINKSLERDYRRKG